MERSVNVDCYWESAMPTPTRCASGLPGTGMITMIRKFQSCRILQLLARPSL